MIVRVGCVSRSDLYEIVMVALPKISGRLKGVLGLGLGLASLAGVAWFYFHPSDGGGKPARMIVAKGEKSREVALDLNENQVATLRIAPVAEKDFPQERRAVGNIDFNQHRLADVFSHYQGRILEAGPNVGDRVEKDQFLFAIESPDLLAAEQKLIAVAGSSAVYARNLQRARALIREGGVSQQAADQAVADQQNSEGAIKVARDNVRLFGKSEQEIDSIILDRRADSRLVVKSPIAGYVVARSAAPGGYVQPGVVPAPYTVADTSTMWMVANVVENDAPLLRLGQKVKASVFAFPGRVFEGKIVVLGAAVDPDTRRVLARCEIADPEHLLRAGMFATFVIEVAPPVRSPAVPQNAVVRETDGHMSVWTTKDRRVFIRRTVETGLRTDGLVQIVSGLDPGTTIVGDGAVFLSNEVSIRSLD